MSQLFTSSGKSSGVSASISPSNEYSGLISFRIDWLDLLAVQGTLKSPLQRHSRKHESFTLSLLRGPTLTSVHDCWKNHSFDQTDLCWLSYVSAFLISELVKELLAQKPRSFSEWRETFPAWRVLITDILLNY